MTCLSRCLPASSALVFLSSTAFADVSAEDVWADWRTYAQSFGYQVAGQEQRVGDQLVIAGVTMTASEEMGGAEISLDQIIMTEQSDGSVSVDLPAIMPMTFSSPDIQGNTTRISMDYRQSGLDIVASGTPDALNYDYSADTITLETTGFEVNGKILPKEQNYVLMTFEGMNGTATSAQSDGHQYSQEGTVASVGYSIKAFDTVSQSASDITGQIQDLTFSGETNTPFERGATGSINAMLADGLSALGTISYKAIAYTVAVTANGQTSEASISSGSGNADFSVDGKGVAYDLNMSDTQAELTSAQVPLPLSFSIDQSAFNILLPLQESETAGDFAIGVLMEGFSMPEALWGLFDPSGQLPRDPATVALDLSGKARLLFDLFDPASASALVPGTPPAEIESLNIESLRVSAVGAELTGNGRFEFENSGNGPPKPTGTVDMALSGGNGLVDKLIASGLLPEQDAMGVRMMMGLFGVPGDAPDTLTSKIEINDQGHVMANGQRIQ